MFKIEESAVAELSDHAMLLMAQLGLVLFVIWLIAATTGKGHLGVPRSARAGAYNPHAANKWYAAADTNPRPYNETAWKTAVGMAVSA